MISQVKQVDGQPTLFVNGEAVPEMAYITYKTANNRYENFAKAGIKLYSVNLNFSELPINEITPVLVFQKGIFLLALHMCHDFLLHHDQTKQVLFHQPKAI